MNLHIRMYALACAAGLWLAPPVHADPGASVTGRIRYPGKAPARARITPTKDPGVCGRPPLTDESLVVGKDGGLAGAVVSIEGAPADASAPGVARVDQVGCRFVPHVQAAVAGSELQIKSSDNTLHNVHAYQDGNTRFNIAMPVKGSRSKQKLTEPGLVSLKCDAGHTWMQAFIQVLPHRLFAVTDEAGKFRIAGVPAGSHKVKVWHEKLGERMGLVDVKEGGEATFELTMGPAR
jgi:plastocyanin